MITRIIVENYELELSQDIAVPLNFSLQEFRYPEKRKRSFSKTITIPGTQKNMDFFMSAYNINLDVSNTANLKFKPNQAPQCTVKRDDIIIFRGLLKLNQVNILNKIYSFECTIYSEVVDIFATLKSIKLNELDWSEYDHNLTRTNIINSWSSSVIKNGISTSNFIGANGYDPQSFGYVYPLINFGYSQPATTTYKANQIFPYVYVKECLTKILNYAYKDTGIEVDYTTNFFNNIDIKKMIYGFGGGDLIKLSSAAVAASKFEFLNATYSNYFTCPPGGYNAYRLNFEHDLLYDLTIPTITQNQNILKTDNGHYIQFGVKALYTFTIKIVVSYYGGTNNYTTYDNYTKLKVVKNNVVPVYTSKEVTYANYTYTLNYSFDLDINAGETLQFIIEGSIGSSTQNVLMSITDCDFTMVADKSQELSDNAIVSLNSTIPTINCADFLKGILNMFYATVSDPIYDPVTSKRKVYIDAFNDFYQDQSINENWSDKLDELRDINIECNSLIEGKNYIFQYNEEKDFFNNEYKRITGENMGELNQFFDTFQSEEKIFKLPFSTYPIVKISGSNLRIPHILEDNGTVVKSYKGGGQIAFYNGLRTGSCNIMQIDNTIQTASTVYPFIHHFRMQNSDNYIPLFDLHYKSRLYTFDEIAAYPSLNIYSKYYSKFINELTSVNAKLLRAYFKLNDKDISEMDFSKLKLINGNLFRLYAIKDYDNLNYGTTQCELIKFLG